MNRDEEIEHMQELVRRFGPRSTIGMLREAIESCVEDIPNANERAGLDYERAASVLHQAENRL